MALVDVLSDGELHARLLSCDEKLGKVSFSKRAQLISLCQAQAKALAHFRSAPQILPRPETVLEPIILEIVVSEGAGVGGVPSGNFDGSEVSFCEMGIGNGLAVLDTRSISSQVTTTLPSPRASRASSVRAQAPPVRHEVHYLHHHHGPTVYSSVDPGHENFGASEGEDESEYPLGYYDESDDDYGEFDGHLASPQFCPSQLAQAPTLGTGSQGESHGGVLDVAATDFFPPAFISTGNASLSLEHVDPVNDDNIEFYPYSSDDHEEHDSGGAYEDDADPSGYDSGDHYDSWFGGASSESYCGYSSGSS
ncbi:hypothetical protein CYMTET_22187 [Cymbomonas tetramitiformis]|uniref:Uncharacterized protein n=1 Tax=Cymbomonas tetramitiformis TaxID=36881 RepID=A0AAE0G0N6_9CHLO|nr:hypothetical protein CYMTET_22187 [Cymbomonas tetramitiformis]